MSPEQVISDTLRNELAHRIARGDHWIAANTIPYFLEKGDVYCFHTKDEALEFSDNNISEYDDFRVFYAEDLQRLISTIHYGEIPGDSIPETITKYIYCMNEKNLEYLGKQVMYTGFGEGHQENLKAKMEEGASAFMLTHQKDFGNDKLVATLQFAKSETSDNYFFNRYQVVLKTPQQEDPVKQTFYVNNSSDNITLKEAYNLLSGRAVYKEFSNKEGEKYQAWAQLDFKAVDKHGNFEMKKFNQNYGFDLRQSIEQTPLKDLAAPAKKMLIESLERGNRQSVTFQVEGKDQKVFIEAAPQYKSMNFYDGSMKRVMVQNLYEKAGDGKTNVENSQQRSQQQSAEAGGEEGPAKAASKKKGKNQGMNV